MAKKYIVDGSFAHPCDDDKPKQSDSLIYIGPNLPCSGVHTCEDFTTVIQKIDDALCSIKLQLYNLTTTTTTTITP